MAGNACGKKILSYNTPRPPMSVHTKLRPNWSSCLAGYRQHIYIYECLVLLHRYAEYKDTVNFHVFYLWKMSSKLQILL